MKSLSELQSSPDVGPLERVVDICVAGKVVDQFDRKSADLLYVRDEIARLRKESEQRRDDGGPPRRMGQATRLPELEKQSDELAVEADALRERVAEHSVAVRLRVDEGKWRQFKAEHPARDEQTGEEGKRHLVDVAGYGEDVQYAGGQCNVADLVKGLRQWIVGYNDEPPSEAWWEFLQSAGVPGDMLKAAGTIKDMHTDGVDPGKSRVAWLAGHRSSTGSE